MMMIGPCYWCKAYWWVASNVYGAVLYKAEVRSTMGELVKAS